MIWGMGVTQQKPKVFPSTLRAVMAGTIAFLLMVLVDQLSRRFGLTGVERLGDNVLGAIVIGVLMFVDDRRKSRYLAERLRVIALMNHHVRNSLQTIKFAHQTDHQVQLINDAVVRIEWALREILPGGMVNGASKPGAETLLVSDLKRRTSDMTLKR